MNVDATDLEILGVLQEDGRMTNKEIADRIGMAPSATFERIRKLEKKGVIKGYEVRLDGAQLDCGLVAFVFVRTSEQPGDASAGSELARIPEVQELFNVAGEDCYLLKVRCANTVALSKLLREKIGHVAAVRSTRTTIVMETYKESNKLPLATPNEELEVARNGRR